jgi:curli biogenesis system outer membrane secretion channel CsgG
VKREVIVGVVLSGFLVLGGLSVAAQAPPAAAPKKAAAPKSASKPSPVDEVIKLVRSGVSETLIIKTLKSQNKAISLAPADLVKLQAAKVPESVIEVMMDPSAAPKPAAAAAAATTTAPGTTTTQVTTTTTEAAPSTPAAAATEAPKPAVTNVAVTVVNNPPVPQAKKPRVIVDEFDYSAVATAVQQVFQTNMNIGKGIRAMLIKRVATDSKLVVVERAKIDQLQAEQDRNASNRVKQGTGARIGRITGANALLAGDVIIFGRDDKQMKASGGGFIGRGIGAIGAARKEEKAVVAIAYRLVDAETSEVIATGEARGESARKSKGFGALAGAFGQAAGGVQIDMTSSGFAETIIGEATMDCVNKLAEMLSQQSAGMKQTVREVEALVADVNGSSLTIAAGSGDGVNQGEVFEIHKVVREVKDPVTKEVLDRVTEKIGEMTISTVRDRVSSGQYSGSPGVKSGAEFVARKKI